MNWASMEYILSTHTKEKWPPSDKPEVVIVGRSNVGKSSLINSLSNNKKLAKVSKSPGKTRSLNFFSVGKDFLFVDVPGYGYAKVNNRQKDLFSEMIDEYLSQRTNLKLAIQLLDIRRKPNRDDMDMINYFKHNDIQILYVLTKIDKTNQKETNLGLKTICNTLNIKKDELVLTSSLNRTGLDNLKKSIKHIIKNQ